MLNRPIFPVLFLFLVLFSIVSASLFIVPQGTQAIVLQFGELVGVHQDPGLKFKIPFIQDVMPYEKRALEYNVPTIALTTSDQKILIVNTYTLYRISNPILFFQAVKPANERGTKSALEAIISSSVRNVLGRIPLRTMLSEERSKIMKQIEEEVFELAKPLGLEIINVRIVRTELPPENRNAVFARMNSELTQIAMKNRAEGNEVGKLIRATADKEKTILLAEARKKAQKLYGEGDSKAMQLISTVIGQDKEFYTNYAAQQVARETLSGDTSIVLSTENDLFKFFRHPSTH